MIKEKPEVDLEDLEPGNYYVHLLQGVIRPVGSEKLRFTQRIGENLMDKLK